MSEPATHHRPFHKVCLGASVWIVVIAAAIGFAESRGWLHGLQTAGLDTIVREQNTESSDNIFIVEITDDVYNGPFFHGKSPLNAESLALLVDNVRAAAGDKGVVGVDIDTSHESFHPLRAKYQKDSRIVWAWIPERIPDSAGDDDLELGPFRKVLGADWSPPLPVGVPIFPIEPDGAVRKYRRAYNHDNIYSLHWAVLHRWHGDKLNGPPERYFNFRGNRTRFPVIEASQFLSGFHKEDAARLLNGKCVLIGGSFAAARDEYATAEGRMAGVELIAHAIDSDYRHRGIREFSWLSALPIDFVLGLMVVAAFYFIPSVRLAFWASLLGPALLAVFGSLFAFGTMGYWVDFVPIIIGVLLHQLLGHAERHRDLQQEVRMLKEKLRAHSV